MSDIGKVMKPMKPSHFMNRVLLFVLLLVVGKGALSQERIDTLYYSRSGMTVRNPVFADYYRLALYPADAAGLKMFKDFYISGELRREGHFQTIDTLDDCRTVFDGDVVSYFNKSVDKYINLTNRLLRRFYRGFSNDLENVRNSLLCVIILSNNPCQKQR